MAPSSSPDTTYIRVRRRIPWQRARATAVILVLNVLWFFCIVVPRGTQVQGYLAAGALDASAVDHAGWWRILSSLFVHFTISHLVFNMISLASMYVVEIVVGWSLFVTVFGLAGIMGSLISMWVHPNDVFGGASGAIFGIFGLALWLSFHGVFTKSARYQLLFWLALNVAIGVTETNIGLLAHLCGLAVGLGVGWLLYTRPNWARHTKVFAAILIVFTGIALLESFVSGTAFVA